MCEMRQTISKISLVGSCTRKASRFTRSRLECSNAELWSRSSRWTWLIRFFVLPREVSHRPALIFVAADERSLELQTQLIRRAMFQFLTSTWTFFSLAPQQQSQCWIKDLNFITSQTLFLILRCFISDSREFHFSNSHNSLHSRTVVSALLLLHVDGYGKGARRFSTTSHV